MSGLTYWCGPRRSLCRGRGQQFAGMNLLALCSPRRVSPVSDRRTNQRWAAANAHTPTAASAPTHNHGPGTHSQPAISQQKLLPLSLLASPCRRTCSTGAQPSARPLPESVAGLPDDCCRMTSAPFSVSLRVGEFLEAPPSSTSALPPPLDPPSTTRIRLSQQPIFSSSLLAELESPARSSGVCGGLWT